MMNYKDRLTRLQTIVTYCLEKDITPSKNNFADTVQRIEISKMGRTAKQAAEDTNMLCIAWKTDKWKGYTENMETINIEPITSPSSPQKINIQYGTSEKVKNTLRKIAEGPSEEIKSLPKHESTQPDSLLEQDQAKILYNMAQRDINDGTGRILLHDARKELDNKHLTLEDLIKLWQKYYPLIEIDPKTANVLHVYFDGKNQILQQRRQREPIIPEKFP